MKSQSAGKSSKVEAFITTVIAAFFTMIMVAVAVMLRSVVWPLLRFCGRAALNGMKRGAGAAFAQVPSVKKARARAAMPTPDVFKDAPNLAPAKQVRFR